MNFSEFATAITSFAKDDFANRANVVVQRVATRVDECLVEATPVDTGLMRSNWLVSLDAPDETSLESPYAEGSHLGIYETANAEAAKAQGLSIIEQRRPNQDVYVTNNCGYASLINEGLVELRAENVSSISGENFVELAILTAIKTIGAKGG